MESYTLNLEASWDEVKGMLMEVCPDLTEEDLRLEPDGDEALLRRVSQRLNKDVPSVKAWIESVSHNKGIAS